MPEAGTSPTRLDDRDADVSGGELGHQSFAKALDSPLAGVIHRAAGQRGLPAECRELDDPAVLLSAKVRQRATDDLDRAQQVRPDLVDDLIVGELVDRPQYGAVGIVNRRRKSLSPAGCGRPTHREWPWAKDRPVRYGD